MCTFLSVSPFICISRHLWAHGSRSQRSREDLHRSTQSHLWNANRRTQLCARENLNIGDIYLRSPKRGGKTDNVFIALIYSTNAIFWNAHAETWTLYIFASKASELTTGPSKNNICMRVCGCVLHKFTVSRFHHAFVSKAFLTVTLKTSTNRLCSGNNCHNI